MCSTSKDSFSFSFFYNNIEKLILKRSSYINESKLITYGAEFSSIIRPFPSWIQEINFSLLRYDEKRSSTKLYEEPDNSILIKESVNLPLGLNFTYKALWKDSCISFDRQDNEHELPAYWLHSILINKKINRFKFAFGLTNIFDTYYEQEYGFPGEGINFSFSVEVEVF